jgi:hypothetical protein
MRRVLSAVCCLLCAVCPVLRAVCRGPGARCPVRGSGFPGARFWFRGPRAPGSGFAGGRLLGLQPRAPTLYTCPAGGAGAHARLRPRAGCARCHVVSPILRPQDDVQGLRDREVPRSVVGPLARLGEVPRSVVEKAVPGPRSQRRVTSCRIPSTRHDELGHFNSPIRQIGAPHGRPRNRTWADPTDQGTSRATSRQNVAPRLARGGGGRDGPRTGPGRVLIRAESISHAGARVAANEKEGTNAIALVPSRVVLVEKAVVRPRLRRGFRGTARLPSGRS